jgi:UDP-glucose 4-epimerase
VYGDSETLPKREDMPTAPKSPYAVGKLAGELYCTVFHGIYGLPTVALRYFNVFGPRQDPASRYSAVIPLFINAALSDGEVTVHGDGKQSRDFTFVQNVVEANLLAVKSEKAVGRTINIACGGRTSLLELIEVISSIAGKKIRTRHVGARPGDVRHSQADITRARELLGFEPRVSLREGLEKTVEYFSSMRSRGGSSAASKAGE